MASANQRTFQLGVGVDPALDEYQLGHHIYRRADRETDQKQTP